MTILEKKRNALKAFEEKATEYETAIAELTEKAKEIAEKVKPVDTMDKSTKALAKEYYKTATRVLKILNVEVCE